MSPSSAAASADPSPGGNPARRRAMPIADQKIVPEALFALLDGRQLILLGHRWKVEVFSICPMAGCWYVQLSLSGAVRHLVTLRIARAAAVPNLIPALLAWIACPPGTGQVINVD